MGKDFKETVTRTASCNSNKRERRLRGAGCSLSSRNGIQHHFFSKGYLDKYIKTLKNTLPLQKQVYEYLAICIYIYFNPTTQSIAVILETNSDRHRDTDKGKKRKKTERKPLDQQGHC